MSYFSPTALVSWLRGRPAPRGLLPLGTRPPLADRLFAFESVGGGVEANAEESAAALVEVYGPTAAVFGLQGVGDPSWMSAFEGAGVSTIELPGTLEDSGSVVLGLQDARLAVMAIRQWVHASEEHVAVIWAPRRWDLAWFLAAALALWEGHAENELRALELVRKRAGMPSVGSGLRRNATSVTSAPRARSTTSSMRARRTRRSCSTLS